MNWEDIVKTDRHELIDSLEVIYDVLESVMINDRNYETGRTNRLDNWNVAANTSNPHLRELMNMIKDFLKVEDSE